MDATDQRLLDLLEADARASVTALSEQLRSPAPRCRTASRVWRRAAESAGYTIRRADPRATRLIRAHVMLTSIRNSRTAWWPT